VAGAFRVGDGQGDALVWLGTPVGQGVGRGLAPAAGSRCLAALLATAACGCFDWSVAHQDSRDATRNDADDREGAAEGENAPDVEVAGGGGDVLEWCRTTADCAPHEGGDRCNGTLFCEAGFCAIDPGTVVHCDNGADAACRRNRCLPTTGECRMESEPDGMPCDDGLWCTPTDQCAAGSCAGHGTRCTGPCLAACDETADRCLPAPGGTLCRPATGPCDPAETCTGSSLDCPADAYHSAGYVCRPAAGDCDVAESCTGRDAYCPGDAYAWDGSLCCPGGMCWAGRGVCCGAVCYYPGDCCTLADCALGMADSCTYHLCRCGEGPACAVGGPGCCPAGTVYAGSCASNCNDIGGPP
jgi:hypothetical protein